MDLSKENISVVIKSVAESYPSMTIEYSVLMDALSEYITPTKDIVGSSLKYSVLSEIWESYLQSSNEAMALGILADIFDKKRMHECAREAMLSSFSHQC